MSPRSSQLDTARIKAVAEALLFVSERPVKVSEIIKVLADSSSVSPHAVVAALEELKVDYIQSQRSFRLVEIAGGYQLRTMPEFAPFITKFLAGQERTRLSRPALETLAIVAYRQPITRPQVESIRGVDVGGILKMLQERGLTRIVGRSDSPGRPFLYATTTLFLEHFGLNSLSELPRAAELAIGKSHEEESPPKGQVQDERKGIAAEASPAPETN